MMAHHHFFHLKCCSYGQTFIFPHNGHECHANSGLLMMFFLQSVMIVQCSDLKNNNNWTHKFECLLNFL